MTEKEVQSLAHGLYRVHWKEEAGGGASLAAVGSMSDGSRWLAPTNWTANIHQGQGPGSWGVVWRKVSHVESIRQVASAPNLCPNCRAPLGLLGCDGCDKGLCACCVVGHECGPKGGGGG